MGGTRRRMVLQHIVPNTIGTIMVNATFQVADAILALASLSFLGLGIATPSRYGSSAASRDGRCAGQTNQHVSGRRRLGCSTSSSPAARYTTATAG